MLNLKMDLEVTMLLPQTVSNFIYATLCFKIKKKNFVRPSFLDAVLCFQIN